MLLQPAAHGAKDVNLTDFSQVAQVNGDAGLVHAQKFHIPQITGFKFSTAIILFAGGVKMQVLAEIGHLGDTQVVKREHQFKDVAAPEGAVGGIGMIGTIGKTADPVDLVVDPFGNQLEFFDQLLFFVTEFIKKLFTVKHARILVIG